MCNGLYPQNHTFLAQYFYNKPDTKKGPTMDGDNGDGVSGTSCEGVHTQASVIGFHHGVVFHEHRRCFEPIENICNINAILGKSKEMELERLSTVVFVYKCDLGCHHLVAQEQC
jgi:hypothetical protein